MTELAGAPGAGLVVGLARHRGSNPATRVLPWRRAAIVAGSIAVFLVVSAARLTSDDPSLAITMVYLLPIACLGIEFKVRGGVLAALAASALVLVWVLVRDVDAGVSEILVRCGLFAVLGLGFGLIGDRLSEAVADRALLAEVEASAGRESSRMWEVSFEMLATVRADGYFQQLNPRWQEILGWSVEELLARPQAELVHPDDRAQTARELAKLREGGESKVSFENRYRCRDGSYRWLSWNSIAAAEDGLTYEAAHDITERKRQEAALQVSGAQLRALSEELEERVQLRTSELAAANKELQAFSYSVSHDLRAPLRAIDGYSLAVLEDHAAALPEEAQADLARVRAASQRMATMIDEMLALSRVTRRELLSGPVDLSYLAEEVAVELRRDDGGREVQLTIEPGLEVTGDPVLLQLVVYNLLENSWKFTSRTADPRIVLTRVSSEGGRSTFAVRDNGAGFDMRHADKLFRPFERLHRQDEFSGTGVGLATVARILQRHGGQISAEGSPDGGASFFFDLPTRQEHDA